MSSFLNAFEAESTVGTTENGAVTFTSTLNHNLDFFGLASAKRANPGEAVSLFVDAYHENPVTALLNLFYLRDVRGGQGERDIFRFCLEKVDVKFMKNEGFLKLIPEYGRWDDLIMMISRFSTNIDVVSAVVKIIKEQLDLDSKSEHPSLLAKWIPLANSVSNMERRGIAHALPKFLGTNEKGLRKIIVPIRTKLKITERYMTEGTYPLIEYAKISSRCGYIHRAAFLKHDNERYTNHLADLAAGKTKINSGTLYPYEIIYRLRELLRFGAHPYFYNEKNIDINDPEIVSLIEMWKALPEFFTKGNVLPVVDVSGSMFTPVSFGKAMAIDVSTSLGIYCAQHNTGMFKDHYISFSESPMLIKLNPEKSLAENLQYILSKEVGYDTNFHKVFKVILKSMVRNNLPKEECPSIILAISDMEFNQVDNDTNFERIKTMYSEAGYEMPQLVFWNVMSRGRNVPVRKNEKGVVLVSGMSPSILRFITEGDVNPEKFMLNVLLSERYHPVLEAIGKIA